jgi:predicted SAM-dependent methyltransferase
MILSRNFFKRIVLNNALLYALYIKLRLLLNKDIRLYLAQRYIKGFGIEIGALHSPLTVPAGAKVRYVDRLPVSQLRLQYPELRNDILVDVDIIDNGETLETIESTSLDFVIANHFLEHCENPIGAIKTFLRVLKEEGIVYLSVPDKRFTFDNNRPITKFDHIRKDYNEGPDWSRSEHFREWKILVTKKFKNDHDRNLSTLKNEKYSIHFHVWTYFEVLELMIFLKRSLNFKFEVREFIFIGNQAIFILEKTE